MYRRAELIELRLGAEEEEENNDDDDGAVRCRATARNQTDGNKNILWDAEIVGKRKASLPGFKWQWQTLRI